MGRVVHKRKSRASITGDEVMDAALLLADREGFEAVTIRGLATRVGVAPMTLYGHFADKNALYDGMRNRLASKQLIIRETDSSWQALLERIARNIFGTLRAHPNWLPLFGRASTPPASALAYVERLLALMLGDGLTLERTIHAYASVTSLAYGAVHVERTMLGPPDAPLMSRRIALIKELLPRLPEGRRATIGAVASQIDKLSFDDVFEFGLRSLIRGIEAQRVRQNRKAAPTRGPRKRPRK